MRVQQGPSRSWQEISYWVLTWIWVASGVFGLVQALGMSSQMGGYFGPLSVLHLLIGLGLLTQSEWAIWIAKLVTYLTIVGAFAGILMSFLLKSPLAVAISLAYNVGEFALACFQIYIFGYMDD